MRAVMEPVITAACARATPKGHADCGGRVRTRDGYRQCFCACHPWNKLSAERIVAAAEAGRKCVRCHEDVHASDGEHLCKDLRARLKRQTQAVGVVEAILLRYYVRPVTGDATETVALEIIKAIGGRDNGL